MVGSPRDYSLGTSSCWLYHHCWSLLSTIGPGCSKTQGKVGSNLLFTWQHQTSHRKVNTCEIIEARMGYGFTSTLFSWLGPTDYPLFRSLFNYSSEKIFDEESDLKMDLLNFFDQKSHDFYEGGILSLPERWRPVIDSNGAYTVEK